MRLASNYSLPVPTLTLLMSLTFMCPLLSDLPLLHPVRLSLVCLLHLNLVCPLASIRILNFVRAGDGVLRMLAGTE